jgi:hypothetical protein
VGEPLAAPAAPAESPASAASGSILVPGGLEFILI